MKRALTLFFMLGCLDAIVAQGSAAPPAAKQDPEALKLIERFDSLRYVPRVAGLKDLEFTTKLPSGHNLVLRWKEPDRMKADLAVPADAPADRARQLAFVIPKFQDEARKYAPSFIELQTGEVLREKHKDDDITLAAPNQVKIVARSDASKATLKEMTLTFDEQGLVKQARVTSPRGAESVIEPTFTAWNGKNVYQVLKTKIGQEEQVVAFEYGIFENLMLVKKVITTAKAADGKSREQILEFFDFKVNTGLDDKLFEEKPAEPKPQ